VRAPEAYLWDLREAFFPLGRRRLLMPRWLGFGLLGWGSSSLEEAAEAVEAGDAGAVVASLRNSIVGGGGALGGGGGGDAMFGG